MNETSLLYSQIISEYQNLNVLFVEDASGVSSEEVENAVDDLIFVNFLDITEGQLDDQRDKPRISERGINHIGRIYSELEPAIRERLNEIAKNGIRIRCQA